MYVHDGQINKFQNICQRETEKLVGGSLNYKPSGQKDGLCHDNKDVQDNTSCPIQLSIGT